MTEAPFTVITPQQKVSGYLECCGTVVVHRNYEIISKLDDGNYVARNPKIVLLEAELRRATGDV
jgi:hypothetical protein